jgi:hypothetical protein
VKVLFILLVTVTIAQWYLYLSRVNSEQTCNETEVNSVDEISKGGDVILQCNDEGCFGLQSID